MAGRFDASNYIDVQQRINRFWSEYPDGRIETDLLSDPNNFDEVVFRSRVYKHKDHHSPDSTGIAAERKGGMGANSTSWHENGETSAIGRALANMGYATSLKDRPSSQEMQKVAGQSRTSVLPSPETTEASGDQPAARAQSNALTAAAAAASSKGLSDDDRHSLSQARFGVSSWKDLTDPQLKTLREWVQRHTAADIKKVVAVAAGINAATTPEEVSATLTPYGNDAAVLRDPDLAACGKQAKERLTQAE